MIWYDINNISCWLFIWTPQKMARNSIPNEQRNISSWQAKWKRGRVYSSLEVYYPLRTHQRLSNQLRKTDPHPELCSAGSFGPALRVYECWMCQLCLKITYCVEGINFNARHVGWLPPPKKYFDWKKKLSKWSKNIGHGLDIVLS